MQYPYGTHFTGPLYVYYVEKYDTLVVSGYYDLTEMSLNGFASVMLNPLETIKCTLIGEL